MALKIKIRVPFEDVVRQSPDLYEVVDTGYLDDEGRRVIGEYIFKGQEAVKHCRKCGGVLKEKKISAEKCGACTHIVNGLARPVAVGDDCVLVLWVCNRKCEVCDKNQRVLPAGVRLWMRYALSAVQAILVALFKPEELKTKGALEPKTNRGWEAMAFYGDVSTVYRWRRQAFRWIKEND